MQKGSKSFNCVFVSYISEIGRMDWTDLKFEIIYWSNNCKDDRVLTVNENASYPQ